MGPLLSILITVIGILFFSDIEQDSLLLFSISSFLAFISTRLIFFRRGGSFLAALEVFFFIFVYFRLLDFTRSAPEISHQSPWMAKSLLFLLIISFLLHSAIIYAASFPDRSNQRKRKEALVFTSIVVPLLLVLAYLSPNDFVKHEILFNEWNEKPPPTPQDLKSEQGDLGREKEKNSSNHRNGLPLGNRKEKYPAQLQNPKEQQDKKQQEQNLDQKPNQKSEPKSEKKPEQGSGQGSGQRKDSQRLEGVPADQWNDLQRMQKERGQQGGGGGGGKQGKDGEQGGKQHAIMIIASPTHPVYAAEAYLGTLTSEGFSQSSPKEEPLNLLAGQRMIETWKNRIRSKDSNRKIVSMFFLSTLEKRVVAYLPYQIQPTVKNIKYHPFDLSYHVQSRISTSQPEDWILSRDINPDEKRNLKYYLEVPLSSSVKQRFEHHLKKSRASYQKKTRKDSSTQKEEKYFDKIRSILRGFKSHQYELGFEDKTSLDHLSDFLSKTKKGDCTEFSHTTAILGRLADVPSRVVYGYLASQDLQTPAHRGGVYHLRKKIRFLQKYSLDDLYLITSAHHHAWVQFWIPNYGWIDFETTSFAIPPKPSQDANNMDVIIPMIEEKKILSKPTFVFPWRTILKILSASICSVIFLLYLYRLTRGVVYLFASRSRGEKGIHALQKRILLALASDGYPIKPYFQTTLEYSEKIPPMEKFAKLYTMLRFRMNYSSGEKEKTEQEYRACFVETRKKLRKTGPYPFLRRIMSLRGLYY